MRKLIRKIIKERIGNFDDFDNIDIDLLDYLGEDEKRQVDVYSYTSILVEYKGGFPLMHHFASPEDMKNYISTWNGTDCTQPVHLYEMTQSGHPHVMPQGFSERLLRIFPDADVIKVHVLTDKAYVDFDGSILKKTLPSCSYVQYHKALRGPRKGTFKHEIHLFNDKDQLVPSGYYLLQKDGGITYTPKM